MELRTVSYFLLGFYTVSRMEPKSLARFRVWLEMALPYLTRLSASQGAVGRKLSCDTGFVLACEAAPPCRRPSLSPPIPVALPHTRGGGPTGASTTVCRRRRVRALALFAHSLPLQLEFPTRRPCRPPLA